MVQFWTYRSHQGVLSSFDLWSPMGTMENGCGPETLSLPPTGNQGLFMILDFKSLTLIWVIVIHVTTMIVDGPTHNWLQVLDWILSCKNNTNKFHFFLVLVIVHGAQSFNLACKSWKYNQNVGRLPLCYRMCCCGAVLLLHYWNPNLYTAECGACATVNERELRRTFKGTTTNEQKIDSAVQLWIVLSNFEEYELKSPRGRWRQASPLKSVGRKSMT